MLSRRAPQNLDLGPGDLLAALLNCLRPGPGPVLDQAVACLSVRSAFDLALQALRLEPGEVLVSAITHPHMLAILELHGLTPVPVDLDPETLAPLAEGYEKAFTARTRAVLVTHLFGSRAPLGPTLDFCRRHDLPLWEDCAEGFRSLEDHGEERAQFSMFSFGPLKTSTALGGALVWVRDAELRARMRSLQDSYPIQSTAGFARRVGAYVVFRLINVSPLLFGLLSWALERSGRSTHRVVRALLSNFHELRIPQVRRRPSPALLGMLGRRLARHREATVLHRQRTGLELLEALPSLKIPGRQNREHTFWLFPILVRDPEQANRALARAGFQGVPGLSNLVVTAPPPDRPELRARVAQSLLEHALLVPLSPAMSPSERVRLARVLGQVEAFDRCA